MHFGANTLQMVSLAHTLQKAEEGFAAVERLLKEADESWAMSSPVGKRWVLLLWPFPSAIAILVITITRHRRM